MPSTLRMSLFAAALLGFAAAGLAGVASPAAAAGAACSNSGTFDQWLAQFKQDAAAQGISQSAISAAFAGVTYDPSVISHDRGQGVFRQSFEEFSGRMINSYRLNKGAALIRQYSGVFDTIQKQYGVPAALIVAIWGLETDFGANSGNFATIRSIATLAYDCRRSDEFRSELFDALRLVQDGDFVPSAMHGAWAGEIGQTQFMPSTYVRLAVSYSGHGKPDLIHNVPDVLASTANFMHSYGWQAGQPWDQGSPNFDVIKQWNKSDIYSRTIAAFADRLAALTR